MELTIKNALICPVCGGNELEEQGNNLSLCRYCGTSFHNPGQDDIEKLIALKQAEKYLRTIPPRFDTAQELFRDLIKEYPSWSAPYWGYIRSKYGIKYEYDEIDNKVVPICYDGEYRDFTNDSYFLKALENESDLAVKDKYMDEAARIKDSFAKYQEASKNEDYDVFISFKARELLTSEETKDKKEMERLYCYLADKGLKVFFSPVTMEKHLFKPYYDVYIYNAISKAKVMILYGSNIKYFESTWIRNEWSRYLSLINEQKKKYESFLIVTNGIDENDFPRAFGRRQSMNVNVYKDNWMDLLYKQICNVLEINQEVKTESKKDVEIKVAPVIKEEKPTTRVTPKIAKPPVTNHVVTSPVITSPVTSSSKIKENNKSNPENNLKIVGKKVVEYVGEGGEDVIIPDGITTIGEKAFSGDTKRVKSILIPSSVTKIKGNAFKYDETKKRPIVYFKIESIEQFFAIEGLSNLLFCESVHFIDKRNNEMKEITIPRSIDKIPSYAFCNCSSLGYINIPRNVKSIGSCAFYGCLSLKSILIPSSVNEIGNYSFSGCENLASINIPLNIKCLSDAIFKGCKSLSRIKIPNSVESICPLAFYGCTSLTTITIPKAVKKISFAAFGTCTQLKTMRYFGTVYEWNKIKRSSEVTNELTLCKKVSCLLGSANINDDSGEKFV